MPRGKGYAGKATHKGSSQKRFVERRKHNFNIGGETEGGIPLQQSINALKKLEKKTPTAKRRRATKSPAAKSPYFKKGFSPGQKGFRERMNTKRKTPKNAACDSMRTVFRVVAFFIMN